METSRFFMSLAIVVLARYAGEWAVKRALGG